MYSDVGCKLLPEDWAPPRFPQVRIRTRTAGEVFDTIFSEIPSPDIRLWDCLRSLTIGPPNDFPAISVCMYVAVNYLLIKYRIHDLCL